MNTAQSPKERYLELIQQKVSLNNQMLAMLPGLSVKDQKEVLPKIEAAIKETQKMMELVNQ